VLEELWKLVGTAVGAGLVGSAVTWWTSTRQYRLDRRMTTVAAFVRLTALAHGYPPEARDKRVGTGEQAAAIHLVADMGRRDRWLRVAAYALLDDLEDSMQHTDEPGASKILGAARAARRTLPPRSWTWGFRRSHNDR
jgi:hypothetical protein